jgi:hypothetical protein
MQNLKFIHEKEDPLKKKEDPLKKKEDPLKKKEDPLKVKKDEKKKDEKKKDEKPYLKVKLPFTKNSESDAFRAWLLSKFPDYGDEVKMTKSLKVDKAPSTYKTSNAL